MVVLSDILGAVFIVLGIMCVINFLADTFRDIKEDK